MEMGEELLRFFFSLRDTLKLYHWQTRSYARHKATDKLLKRLEPAIDAFVESYAGRYGRQDYGGAGFSLRIPELDDAGAGERLRRYAEYLREDVPKALAANDTDLLTLRDEMLSALNEALYLYELR
jgi:Family of unknown function (DUF5856)